MKRILTILLVLCSLTSLGQTLPGYFAPIASPYEYAWLRAKYLRLPKDTLSYADSGSKAYINGVEYTKHKWWAPTGGGGGGSYTFSEPLTTSGALVGIDTTSLPAGMATKGRLYKTLDSLKTAVILNTITQQTANFNITGNGIMGGDLDVNGHGNFAQNRVQLYHATQGGATDWYNTSGDLYASVNPDVGGYVSTRRFVFNMALGDPTVGSDNKGYFYMKGGVPWWSYNGVHTQVGTGSGGGSSTTRDLTDVSDAYPTNNATLVYNGDSAKYVPTQVATYNLTSPQNGQVLEYQNGTFINGHTADSIQVSTTVPTHGNMYFNPTDTSYNVRYGTTWYKFKANGGGTSSGGGGGGGSNFTLESGHNATLSGTTVSRTAGAGDWDVFINTGEQLASAGDYLVFYADWGAQVNVGIANNNALVSNGASNGILPGMDASLTLASDGNLYRDPAVNFADVGDWSAGLWIKILRASDTLVEYYRSTDGVTWGSAITTSTISAGNAGHVYASPHTGTIQNFTHN